MTTKQAAPARSPVLGNTVRCAITGYTGVANQQVELLGGTVQFSVQPKVGAEKDSAAYPDGMNIDAHMLDFVDEGVAARVTPVTETVDVALGEKVEDRVTGFVGIATAKHTFANGCVYFSVTPQMSKDDKEKGTAPNTSFFAHGRLKKVNSGVTAAIVIPPVASNGKVPGGPATKMRRAS